MKTDSLFYRLFKKAPQLVLELAGLNLEDPQGYVFRSEEIKQTAFRIDGVLTPPPENPDLPIIFVEVQFKPDPHFYSRFFCEIFFYLHQNKPSQRWQAVVIYPTRQIESDGNLHYSGLLESNRIKRIYLEDLTEPPQDRIGLQMVQLIVIDENQAISSAQNLLNRIKIHTDEKTATNWLEWVETILVYKLPRLSRQEIQTMLGFNDIELKQTQFYQDVFSEGLQEGRREGLHEGEAKILTHYFKRLFGDLPATISNAIQLLSNEQLETLADHLPDIKTTHDLTTWLTQNGSVKQ